MEALTIICREHADLWRLTRAVDAVAAELRQGNTVDAAFFEAFFDYLEGFVDRYHHPKEDDLLFPRLRERDPEAAPLLDRLGADHRVGAERLAGLRAALTAVLRDEAGAEADLADRLAAYAKAQIDHIRLEETEILPRARKALTAADWEAVDAAFRDNDDPLFGPHPRIAFRALVHRMAALAPETVGLGGHASGVLATDTAPEPLLRVTGLETAYGRIKALEQVDLEVRAGEIVALVGANGAGKTTILRTLSGVQPATAGRIVFDGEDITALKAGHRVRRGICQSPEGRQVFGPLSIEDNLRLGAYTAPAERRDADLDRIWAMFPILHEKRRLPAGTLSGGQQQMLAIGRALMGRPKLLLLDEPSMGLAPLLVEEVFALVESLKAAGITILVVEQNAAAALAIADRGYVLETGRVTLTGTGADLLASDEVRAAYLGM